MQETLNYIQENKQRYVDELFEFNNDSPLCKVLYFGEYLTHWDAAFSIRTNASLKHAPPPKSLTPSEINALDTSPLATWRIHKPFGISQTPTRIRASMETGKVTVPRLFDTTTVSPSVRPRSVASIG